MVYTLTVNPSLDYSVRLDRLYKGKVNRLSAEEFFIGGKGINVSIMLFRLGIENAALGFTAGFTGAEIERRMSSLGCVYDFIRLKNGNSRVNVKISCDDETEINGAGPEISKDDVNLLFDKLSKLTGDDFLVLAGSIPPSLPSDFYESIMDFLKDRNVNFAVDAEGDLLKNSLKYAPFLIKPNNYELGRIFDKELSSYDEIIYYSKKLQKLGARNVLVSMAKEGAVLISEKGEILKCPAPSGKLSNSVGAGDSMVAGFIAGFLKTDNLSEALKLGVASGSATAFSKWLGDKALIDELMRKL